jgi:membrane-associated phospholipid phosphatase
MTSGDLLAGELKHRAPVDKTSARATSDSRARANSRARRARSRRVCVALAAALLAGAAIARAQDPIVPSVAPPTVRTQHARRDRVEWDWPRFRLWEYAGTAGVYTADWYVRYHELPPDHPTWLGQNPFDDTIRDWLRATSPEGRARAVKVSDWVSLAGTAYPFAIDLPVALFVHRQPGVMWQLLMMDLEANSVAGLLNNTLFHVAGRARPSSPECAADPTYDSLCGDAANNASFPSGHVLTIATAAGLVCVHHRYLPLYDSDAADAGACALLSAATLATGVARIMADRHFASDVIAGGAIGFGSGYGLPWLLHYRHGRTPDAATETRAATLLPLAGPDVLGLSLVGLGPF